MAVIEFDGRRVGIGEHEGTWICTAKRDLDNQFHVAKALNKHRAMCALAESVGVDLEDG